MELDSVVSARLHGSCCAPRRLIGLVLLVLSLVSGGNATEFEPRDLGEAVRESVFIGLVRVKAVESLYYPTKSGIKSCGAVYEFEVSERVSGHLVSGRFFGSRVSDPQLDAGREFLVIVVERIVDRALSALDRFEVEKEVKDYVKCQAQGGDLAVGADLMVPLNPKLSEIMGEKWLERRPETILWSGEFDHDDFEEPDGHLTSACRWENVRQRLLGELN